MIKLENIKKGWKTTICGIVIFICSVVSVFTVEGIGWSDAAIGIAASLVLLGINENKDARR